ncbi:helix-turn-helix transcriptional regulator [Brevibacillus panacihumi]|uniref:helix-turn-helix transcriptional regulator n=1 Tax=Brevibacillus panacihumi TaxID=497735 RepID=UPI003CFD3EF6
MRAAVKIEHLNKKLFEKGLTRRAFAKKAGIGYVTASQICTGQRKPSPPIAKKIVDALGTSFDEIFEFEMVR